MSYIRNHRFASGAAGLLLLALIGVVYAADTDVRFYDRSQIQVHTGTTDVDASAADYTSFQALLTIEPPSDAAMHDVLITLDLDKTTTGYIDVSGGVTGQLALQRKVDGTNWRTDIASIQTLSAATAWEQSKSFEVKTVEPTSDLRVVILQSTEAGDIEVPYRVTYRAPKAASFTDVAN